MDSVERSDEFHLRTSLEYTSASTEQSFGEHYHQFYYRYAQAGLGLGIVLILADFLVDQLAFSSERANIYRLEVCVPILGFGIAYSLTPIARLHWQAVMSCVIVVVACSLFWVLLIIDREGGMGLKSWVGLLNFVFLEFYCFLILGVQFRFALPAGLLIILTFEAFIFFERGIDHKMFFYWFYHTVTLFILAAGVGWWREFLLRRNFSMQTSLRGARNVLASQNTLLENEVHKRTRTIQRTEDAAFILLASLVETRDNETGNHVRRTQHYVRALARRLQAHPGFAGYLVPDQIDVLFKSAPLHDIGKVGIPDNILLKPGKLDPEEFAIMQTHTNLGYDAIENAERRMGVKVEFLACAKEIALNHHEKWDGSGYPRKLVAQDIPISARLMALADVYDALTTRRVYKEAIPHDAAVEVIMNGGGKHFDPDVVAAFASILGEFKLIANRYSE